MKCNQEIRIITEYSSFSDRVEEINSTTSFDDVKHCVSQIKKALYNNKDCAAICAPQIGYNLRLFVVKTSKDEADRFKVFLNPMIINSKGLHMSRESSISFPNKQYIIPRKNELHLAYQTIDGKVESNSYIGAFAEVIQQMVEMLDGITLPDYGLDLDDVGGADAFDKASNKNKAELIALYLDSLKDFSNELSEEIENNPELKYMSDVIKFNTGVLKGDIEIIEKPKPVNSNTDEVSDAI